MLKIMSAHYSPGGGKKHEALLVLFINENKQIWHARMSGSELCDFKKFQAKALEETGQLFKSYCVDKCHSQREERRVWNVHVAAMLDQTKRKNLPLDCDDFASEEESAT